MNFMFVRVPSGEICGAFCSHSSDPSKTGHLLKVEKSNLGP